MIYDGNSPIADFIRKREELRAEPWFRGSEQYRQLWDAELLLPEISTLRVYCMGGIGCDFIYFVESRDTVSGTGSSREYLVSPEGTFSIEDALDKPDLTFEVSEFNIEKLYAELFPEDEL